jgi:hypothetical protein
MVNRSASRWQFSSLDHAQLRLILREADCGGAHFSQILVSAGLHQRAGSFSWMTIDFVV